MFLCVASFGFLEPFVSVFMEGSGLSRSQIGVVSASGTGLALLIQPWLGRLSDRLDARRPLMAAAAAAAGFAYLGYRFAYGVIPFILLTALGVNGVMYLNTAAAVIVGRMAALDNGGKGGGAAFASYRVWGSVGYVVVSLLTGLLLSRNPAGAGDLSRAALAPLFLYGPLLFFLIVGLVCFLPDPKRAEHHNSGGGDDCGPEAISEGEGRVCGHNLQRYLRAHFLFIFAYCGASAYLGLHLKGMGATPLWITAVFAAGVLCEAIVMTQAGKLSDRFGRRPLLSVAYVMMPVRLLLYAFAGSPIFVLGVQTIHGLNFGILVAVSVTFVNDLCGEHNRGAAQARLATTGAMAAALGPLAGGWLSQQFGLPWTFGIMALVAAGGAASFVWKVRESHPHPDPLHRHGPAYLRPILRVMSVPGHWLSRAPRWRTKPGSQD
jgi:MFS family permease